MKAQDRYDSLFRYYAERHRVDWKLLKAQVRAESAFNPDAVSPAGAKGLSQFLKRTFDEWHDETVGINMPADRIRNNEFDPEDSIRAQAAFMAWLLGLFDGKADVALAAYNYGPTRILQMPWQGGFTMISAMLPKETQDYVERILRFYDEYSQEP